MSNVETSTNPPRVSIGMPLYNSAKYLDEALDCLLSQTYRDFELVISDNASTDGTREMCLARANSDPRIRYHRQGENQGAVWNFNEVFKLSRGEYFKWAAYDDICKPTFLARCVEILDSKPQVAWCHTQSGKIDSDGEVVTRDPEAAEGEVGLVHTRRAGLPRTDHASPHPYRRFEGVLLGTNWCADSYGLIRADVMRRTNLLPNCYGAEKVLMAALSLHGIYHEIPETLFYQRVHSEASGNLKSAAAKHRFAISGNSSRFAFTRLRLLQGYLRAVRSAPLSFGERFRCRVAIVKYLFQFKKWRNVFGGAFSGVGSERRESVSAGA